MSWKDFNFMKPEAVDITIGDETIRMFPLSLKATFKLQTIAGPLLEAVTVLVTRNEGDTRSEVDHDKNGKPSKIRVDAVSADMAKLRTEQRKAAVRKAAEVLLDPRNAEVLGYILADSLRDDFARDTQMPEKVEFVEAMPIGVLAQMITGLFKANKKVFGPLAGSAGGLLEKGLTAANFDLVPKDEEEPETTG